MPSRSHRVVGLALLAVVGVVTLGVVFDLLVTLFESAAFEDVVASVPLNPGGLAVLVMALAVAGAFVVVAARSDGRRPSAADD